MRVFNRVFNRSDYKRILVLTLIFIMISVTAAFSCQADQPGAAEATENAEAAENAYDLRMQYTEELIQQDAYNTRMDYYEQMEANNSIREQIVQLALSFVGITPYVPGGGNLWTGTDCSGFICLIYSFFGYWLPAGSDAYQDWVGYHVTWEQILPGDIIVYDNGAHVGIYAGYGFVVHCSSEENGTVCWPVTYRTDATAIVRVID